MSRLLDLLSRLAWRYAEYRLRSAPPPDLAGKRPVFLLFTPRSGSKHFLGLLDSIPGARFDFEILGRVPRGTGKMFFGPLRKPARRLLARRLQQLKLGPHFLRPGFGDPIFSSKSLCLAYIRRSLDALGAEICAVKFQYEDLQLGGISPADLHQAFPNAKFVVLYRRSMSRQLVSDVMRHVTQTPGIKADREYRESQRGIRLAPAKIRSYFAAVRAIHEEWMSLPFLAEHGTVLSYEELCDDPQGTFERSIFPLLDLPATPVTNDRYQKQTHRPISEIVENYDEVADLLESPESWHEYKPDRSPAPR